MKSYTNSLVVFFLFIIAIGCSNKTTDASSVTSPKTDASLSSTEEDRQNLAIQSFFKHQSLETRIMINGEILPYSDYSISSKEKYISLEVLKSAKDIHELGLDTIIVKTVIAIRK
ncbi:MAG: hypothetical protein ACI81T_003247 [Bacteroidia bacterium]|jgi:hypothetical protein